MFVQVSGLGIFEDAGALLPFPPKPSHNPAVHGVWEDGEGEELGHFSSQGAAAASGNHHQRDGSPSSETARHALNIFTAGLDN